VDFVKEIYDLTKKFPKEELYGITSQMRRAALSIPSNIAEGASRSSKIERKRYFSIARSSLVEIDTHIEVSIKLGYLSQDQMSESSERMNYIFALLSNLIRKA
jgi:four helix bundle protein